MMTSSDVRHLESAFEDAQKMKFKVREGAGYRQRLLAETAMKLTICGEELANTMNGVFYDNGVDAHVEYLGFLQDRDNLRLGFIMSVNDIDKELFNFPVPVCDTTNMRRVYNEKCANLVKDKMITTISEIVEQKSDYKKGYSLEKVDGRYLDRDKDQLDNPILGLRVIQTEDAIQMQM